MVEYRSFTLKRLFFHSFLVFLSLTEGCMANRVQLSTDLKQLLLTNLQAQILERDLGILSTSGGRQRFQN